MPKSKCTHGMPSMKACVECMMETGVGPDETRPTHGVFRRCSELIADGTSDIEIPSLIYPTLSEEERAHLVMVALRAYAAQARNAWARRPELVKEKRSAALKELWRVSKEVSPTGRMIRGAGLYLRAEFRAQQVALGNGERIARGEMAEVHLVTKLQQLQKIRNGLDEAIADFEMHLEYLRESGYATLNDAAAHLELSA